MACIGDGAEPVAPILDAVRAAGVPILDVAAEQPDLEDVFVELTRD